MSKNQDRPYVIFGLLLISALFFTTFPSPVYAQEKEPVDTNQMWLGGRVIWQGHDLSKATVEVYRDPKFNDLYTSGILLKAEGIYSLTIKDPGTYYVVAFVDDNDNGRFDAGDGMGIYGVAEWANADQKPNPVQLTSGAKLPGIDIQITAIVGSEGRMIPIEPGGSSVVTGASGKLVWPNHRFPNTTIFAYSDPWWNNRIAQTSVKETGEYEMSLPPGRYYLLAVIDENNTNLLDVDDEFGIWGVTRLGMFPKAVEVKEGNVTKNRNILITGKMGVSGKPLPLQEIEKGKIQDATAPVEKLPVSGNVIWPEHDLRSGMVQAYSDPSMTVAAAQAKTDDKGRFRLLLPAGDYYVMAGVDTDGDGKYTSGDGIGAYGVTNAAEQMPGKLTVTADSPNAEINLLITAEFDGSGQLRPISVSSMQDAERRKRDTGVQNTGIHGRISWEGKRLSEAVLIFSDEPGFEDGARTTLQLEDDGSYTCLTPPGDYYLMVIADLNGNGLMDPGDGRGFYGAGYRGTAQQVTVLEGYMTPLINIKVTESLDPDGQFSPIKTAESIRFWYGEPGDVYINRDGDYVTQEWWYWSRGFTFTFEETDAGLNLIDTNEFTPVEPDRPPIRVTEPSSSGEETEGTLYYTFDMIVWAADTDGTDRRWVVTGTRPTAASDGSRLVFLDTGGNIYLIEPGRDTPAELILGRRKAALQPAISHNGKTIAFTQGDGLRQIILRNLETKEEDAIPGGGMDLYHPAWSSDDRMIAYSASLPTSADQQASNRDIYLYDLVTGRTQGITTSPQDEFEPAWSPANRQTLVYCRAEGSHSQLWTIAFDTDGNPTERQLTRYGGQNPAWSPEGDRIVYENNAQLWIINPDGSGEAPIIVNDEPVFGLDPFWTK